MTALPQLDLQRIWFPPVETALDDPNGLLAFGGDLRPERLLAAYRRGIFPWYQAPQPILWWCPDPRALLYPERLHISRSLRKLLKRRPFQLTMDRQFEAVIRLCSAPLRQRTETWIGAEMRQAYLRLHRLGHAHSVEVWLDEQLVGGLYGVALGGIFFGESMFSLADNASKVALVHLCGQLRQWNFSVIDCQVGNSHTRSLGATEASRSDFQSLLRQHIDRQLAINGSRWEMSWQWAESVPA